MRKFVFSAAMLVTLIFGPQFANAAPFSFTGSFVNDNDVQFFNVTVGAPAIVTLRTFSYAGGTNAAGSVIPAGGFDPNLSVFDPAGSLIAVNNDGTGVVPVDPAVGAAFDSFLQFNATSAGQYLVALTQSDNLAFGPALANGFSEAGDPAFTRTLYGCGPTSLFCDINFTQRTSQWALDILDADSAAQVGAATPLPATLPLFASGLGALSFFAWRRKRKAITGLAA